MPEYWVGARAGAEWRKAPRSPRPPWRLMLRAPVFGTIATYEGLVRTVGAWADCPLGNDAGASLSLNAEVIFCVWPVVILAVGAAQTGLWALSLPVPALRCLRWLVPVVVAAVMFAAFRAGMGSPHFEPDGDCFAPYPRVPF